MIATPVSGILADRIDRRTILVVAYSLQTIITGAYLWLYLADQLTPWRLLGLAFLSGSVAGFQWAPIQAMAAVLVPRRLLVDAAQVVSISFTAGRAVGPAIAGIILRFSGPGLAFAGTFASYLLGVGLLSRVRTDWQPGVSATEPFLTQFRLGVRYVRERPGLRLVIATAFWVAMLGAVWIFALTPSLAEDLFDAGGGGLGALATCTGLGSVVASIFIAGRGGKVRRSRIETASMTLYMTGLVTIAATGSLAVGLIGFAIAGGAHMLHGVTMNTSLQVQADDEYRGRVMSVWLTAVLAGLPIGALVGGALADRVNIQFVVLGSTALLATMVALQMIVRDGFKPFDYDPQA